MLIDPTRDLIHASVVLIALAMRVTSSLTQLIDARAKLIVVRSDLIRARVPLIAVRPPLTPSCLQVLDV